MMSQRDIRMDIHRDISEEYDCEGRGREECDCEGRGREEYDCEGCGREVRGCEVAEEG